MENWGQCSRALQRHGVATLLFPATVNQLLAQVNKARNRQSASAQRNTAARYICLATALFRWFKYVNLRFSSRKSFA